MPMKNFNELYDDKYFENRFCNDAKRLISFQQEKIFLKKYVDVEGIVCDVGCSTGEFLTAINWIGPKYGMEINVNAIKEAQSSGISFEKNILTEKNFFDLVIFRGTIQHLVDPFVYIQKSFDALKKGGHIVFLATPNTNSIFYKIFNTLPALDPKLNFYVPSDISISNVVESFNFNIVCIEKPYLHSPYANPIIDHFQFVKSVLFRSKPSFAFWGNMMNVIAQKR